MMMTVMKNAWFAGPNKMKPDTMPGLTTILPLGSMNHIDDDHEQNVFCKCSDFPISSNELGTTLTAITFVNNTVLPFV
jgi:hypothetical protein